MARFDLEFRHEMVPAFGILTQRVTPMAGQSQGSHELLVGYFVPGLSSYCLSGTAHGLIVATGAYVVVAQMMERRHQEPAAAFAPKQDPFLKLGAPVQVEPFEEVAPVQADGAFQLLDAGWDMTILLHQPGERGNISMVIAGEVELKAVIF
ncbi:MAG: hypothetical protein M1546_20905 [Chloroflexi bacterium]|nr:hypothetical protein [Chloroflexota bacterium]